MSKEMHSNNLIKAITGGDERCFGPWVWYIVDVCVYNNLILCGIYKIA